MDNDLTNPKRVQDVASDSKCPVKLSLSVSFRRMPLRSPHGFESGTRRGGRVIGLLAPLIPEYYQWFSTDPPRYRSPVLISANSFLFFFLFYPQTRMTFRPSFVQHFWLIYLIVHSSNFWISKRYRSFSFGILFFWTIICNNFSSSNRIFCEYVVCFFILQVSSIKVLILKNYEIFFASRSPRISE